MMLAKVLQFGLVYAGPRTSYPGMIVAVCASLLGVMNQPLFAELVSDIHDVKDWLDSIHNRFHG